MRSSLSLVAAFIMAACAAGCSDSAPSSGGTAASGSAAEGVATVAESDEADAANDEDAAEQTADAEPAEDEPQVDPLEQVRADISAGDLDKALATIDAAAAASADNEMMVLSTRYALATMLHRAGRSEEAFAQHTKAAEGFLALLANDPAMETMASTPINTQLSLARTLGGPERVDEALDKLEAIAQAVPANRDYAVAFVTGRRAVQMAVDEKFAEARALVQQALDAAPAPAADADAEQAATALLIRSQLQLARATIEAEDPAGDAGAAWDQHLAELFAADAAHADAEAIRARLFNMVLQRAMELADQDADRADDLLDQLAKIEEFNVPRLDDAAVKDAANAATRYQTPALANLFRARLGIAKSRKLLALYGTPAEFPVTADRWVNAEAAVTPDQLRGKVVLLDFFAVWCGPCIATFPHLREWQDKFGADGFQIIGVSNYQNYGWNDELSRAQREPGITPDKERDDLAKFAKHYELPYPIALTPDRSLQEHYLISGIPHVVLIDRAGKVRLHRIGSGEQNARDLEHAIEECLKESPTGPAA